MRGFKMSALFLAVVMLMGLWAAPSALAAEKPQYGGILRVALAGDPPSLDMHRETTFKVVHPTAPCYNQLVRFDPHNYPKIVGDLAESFGRSEDGMTWTFKLHQGVKFHDGSELTSADVKASWDKIVFPSKGVVSARRSMMSAIKSIETPDRYTAVFRLKFPSASFLALMAKPYHYIYSKKMLDKDMQWYRRNVMGTGPFMFKKYVRGSYLELERNPNYFKKGLPYLDGIKYFMIKDLSARAKSVRTDRTDVEFRGFPDSEVEAMKKQMGDKLVVRYPRINIQWGILFNVNKKPFDDERVRKALSLALDRYDMAKLIGPTTGLSILGGTFHPDSPWALTSEELQERPGWGKDHAANVAEAKRLLAEAGYPNGFKTVLTNRAVKLPYGDFAVYVISSWKKIGVEAEHKLEESATWTKNRRDGRFVVGIDPYGTPGLGDPDSMLQKFLTGSTSNYGGISDPFIDEMFEKQKVELDEEKRKQMVLEVQKHVMDKAYWSPGLWWLRAETRTARMRNYEPLHFHHMNRRLEDVWLAAK
jgi:peptide/nickel transport system substrate-binding protein